MRMKLGEEEKPRSGSESAVFVMMEKRESRDVQKQGRKNVEREGKKCNNGGSVGFVV